MFVGSPEEMRSTDEKNECEAGGCGRCRSAANSGNAACTSEGSFRGLAPSDLR